MKISNTPPGPNRPGSTPGAEKPSQKGVGFRVSPEKVSSSPLSQITARYKSEDLKNTAKTETLIRESLQAIVREQPVASRLPEEHLDKLVDFLQADPSVRSRITSYLEKILS
jgi:hypothetical protein